MHLCMLVWWQSEGRFFDCVTSDSSDGSAHGDVLEQVKEPDRSRPQDQ